MVCSPTTGRLALKQGETKYTELLLIATLLNYLKTEPFLSPSLLGEEQYGKLTC